MSKFNTVLLIEDDAITSLLCKKLIENCEFAEEIVTASNSLNAIEFLTNQSKSPDAPMPDIVFVDINMPVMNGWEFLEFIETNTSIFPKLPLIYILSSSIDMEDYKKAAKYKSVVKFISKPLTKEILSDINPN